MKRKFEELCWSEVVWRRPFEIDCVHNLLSHLASLVPRGPVIWEVRGRDGCVRYLLGTDRKHLRKIRELFAAHGNVEFYHAPEHIRGSIRTVKNLRISHPVLSLKTDASLSVIRAGLAAIASARGKEEIVLQIVFGPSFAPSSVSRDIPDPTASIFSVILGNVKGASPESRSSVAEKARQHGFHAVIRLGASGENAHSRIYSLLSALKTLESAGVRMSVYTEKAGKLAFPHVPWHFPLRLSVKELAHFLLLPAGEEELAGTPGLHPKPLPPPDWYKSPIGPAHDRAFAISTETAEPLRLSISPKDSLEHTIILGPTGCGKSTAMLNLVLADINAGRSVLVIDPKSDLIHDILGRIPENRADEVVVIDPSDRHPVGFNPLVFRGYRNPTLIADAILAVFKEIFSENWGIRSQDILSAALLTLAEIDGASLLWLPALLTDETFRRRITARIKDKVALKPFWNHFEAMKDSERRQEIAPVLNKIRQFLFRPGLRNVLGQSNPRFSLTDLFHKRRIVLVPLNKGVIGAESARLLGSLIVGLTWTLALSRADIPRERRHIVGVYIDELQDYLSLPTDLSDALAEARGLGVSITMAHQYRNQLTPGIRAGIDANARNKIVFGLNSGDAKDMAAMAPELTARDFMSLPRYRVYTSFQSDGRNTGWISGRTLPPSHSIRLAAELKARSMASYGKPAEAVEEEYLKAVGYEETSFEDWGDVSIGRRKL
jgi:DNA polymerase III delta prime subunit